MAKDPAVLFYFQDFLVGTEFMNDDEVGKYIRILCHQADKGALTENQIKRICKADTIPEIILEKLSIDDNGKYYQKRMKSEKEKRENYSESRKKNRGGSSEDMNDISLSHDSHKEDENEDINEDVIVNEIKVEINPEIIELYETVILLFDEDLRPKTDKKKEQWCDVLDKLVNIDHYEPIHIAQIIKLAREDNFWRGNFLTVNKLRRKNSEGIMYIKVFEKKLLNNGKRTGPTQEELTRIAAKHFGITKR